MTSYLGSGSFGNVYSIENNNVLKLVRVDDKSCSALLPNNVMECNLLSQLSTSQNKHIISIDSKQIKIKKHEEFIKKYDIQASDIIYGRYQCIPDMMYGIVIPRYKMDLCTYIYNSERELHELHRDFFDIARQLVEGVASLHQHNFIHGDLKPENVMINPATKTKPCQLALIDFGNSYPFDQELVSMKCTISYRSPEIVKQIPKKEDDYVAFDIWSLGIMFTELLTKQSIVENKVQLLREEERQTTSQEQRVLYEWFEQEWFQSEEDVIDWIQTIAEEEGVGISKRMRAFLPVIASMLDIHPCRRPSLQDIYYHLTGNELEVHPTSYDYSHHVDPRVRRLLYDDALGFFHVVSKVDSSMLVSLPLGIHLAERFMSGYQYSSLQTILTKKKSFLFMVLVCTLNIANCFFQDITLAYEDMVTMVNVCTKSTSSTSAEKLNESMMKFLLFEIMNELSFDFYRPLTCSPNQLKKWLQESEENIQPSDAFQ